MGTLVVGMHRSGTSAITAAVAALGVPLCAPEERIPALDENAEGFHESARLSTFNELLLERLGGRWDAPPPVEPGWDATAEMSRHLVIGRELFATIHQTPTWVWKDPRVCLLLPFWLRALGEGHKLVFVSRSPAAVARSVRMRNRLSKPYALALWERYTREALHALAGRPVFVVNYTALMDDPARLAPLAAELAAFVGDERAADTGDPAAAVARVVKVSLRHNRGVLDDDPEASPSQRQLAAVVRELAGAHRALDLPRLPRETARNAERFASHQTCEAGGEDCGHRAVRIAVPWRPPPPPLELLSRR